MFEHRLTNIFVHNLFDATRLLCQQLISTSIWARTPILLAVRRFLFCLMNQCLDIPFFRSSPALLDIPVYESRIQSLHSLFTLYLGFKNSEVRVEEEKDRMSMLLIAIIFLAF